MDPFTVVWRSHRSGWTRRGAVYHLDEACPFLNREGFRVNRGRLGSMLAGGRRLCAYEARREAQ